MIGLLAFEGEFIGAIFIGGIGLLVGFILSAIFFQYKNDLNNHPLMKEARRSGWSTNKPTA